MGMQSQLLSEPGPACVKPMMLSCPKIADSVPKSIPQYLHKVSQARSALQAGGWGQRVYTWSWRWSRAVSGIYLSWHLAVVGMGVVLHGPGAREMALLLVVLRG